MAGSFGAPAWLFGIAACGSVKKTENEQLEKVAVKKRMAGELERLGKNGQDYLVPGVDAPEFDRLAASLPPFLLNRQPGIHHCLTFQPGKSYIVTSLPET